MGYTALGAGQPNFKRAWVNETIKAYRKVVTELAERGFELVREKATANGEIQLRVRRHV